MMLITIRRLLCLEMASPSATAGRRLGNLWLGNNSAGLCQYATNVSSRKLFVFHKSKFQKFCCYSICTDGTTQGLRSLSNLRSLSVVPDAFYSTTTNSTSNCETKHNPHEAVDNVSSNKKSEDKTTTSAKAAVTPEEFKDAYENAGNISLSSSMQSTVPEPYNHGNKSPSHMNMPQGGKLRSEKYTSEEVTKTHPSKNYSTLATGTKGFPAMNSANVKIFNDQLIDVSEIVRGSKQVSGGHNDTTISQRERFKIAVRDYGGVVVVFHISMSLMFLGASYTAVSSCSGRYSGLDVIALLKRIGFSEELLNSKFVADAGTFMIAYAFYKMFVPLRMAITLTVTPFIVRRLRKIGFLKAPVSK